ncbi:response regulator [Ramlibacter terrae]|uniref:Response regulator n=1 Tax=Ramlibacter terrae TaxID=2732511 RepID=A0ABX6P3C3_9BURK|nr:response regulator [Ramlibacter terrae]
MPYTAIPANVLIVDDQPANLLALEAAPEPLHVNMVRAVSGPQALAALEQRDYAAVLLDVRMPGMDGFEVAREIRARPRTRFTPILFVTAGDDPDEAMMSAYALGAVDFWPSPCARRCCWPRSACSWSSIAARRSCARASAATSSAGSRPRRSATARCSSRSTKASA